MNKQTEKVDVGQYYRENFKSYLVVKNYNFSIETFSEAKVLIKRRRKDYNTFRPHSSLGCLPPAPETVESIQTASTTLQLSVLN